MNDNMIFVNLCAIAIAVITIGCIHWYVNLRERELKILIDYVDDASYQKAMELLRKADILGTRYRHIEQARLVDFRVTLRATDAKRLYQQLRQIQNLEVILL